MQCWTSSHFEFFEMSYDLFYHINRFKGKPGTELGPELLKNPFLLNNLENLSKNSFTNKQ
jgi:hypothetical protein